MEMNQLNKISIAKYRWQYLTVCCLGLLFVGVIYAWSILKVPLAEQLKFSASQLALNYTVLISCFCLGSLGAGGLSKWLSAKYLLISAGFLICMGFTASGIVLSQWPKMLYLCYGIMIGIGVGIAYNTLLAVGSHWFPDKKGFSAGVMMMCFGMSTLVLGKFAARGFDCPSIGWKNVYVILGASTLLILLFCACTLRMPSPEERSGLDKMTKTDRSAEVEYRPQQMLRSTNFWIYYVYGLLCASVGSAVIGFARELCLGFGAGPDLAATLVGMLSIFNGVGRILCGMSYDRCGPRPTLFIAAATALFSPLLMIFALGWDCLIVATISLCIAGISFGMQPTIGSAFISTCYGMENYTINYSIGNTKLLASSFAAAIASALIESSDGFLVPFCFLAALAFAALILFFFIQMPGTNKK